LKADGREHRREVRSEKREGAGLLIHRAGVAIDDEAPEPGAPALCGYRGEFNPKVRKFEQVRGGGLNCTDLIMGLIKSFPSKALFDRERIDLGDFGAVEAGDIEPEIR